MDVHLDQVFGHNEAKHKENCRQRRKRVVRNSADVMVIISCGRDVTKRKNIKYLSYEFAIELNSQVCLMFLLLFNRFNVTVQSKYVIQLHLCITILDIVDDNVRYFIFCQIKGGGSCK